jgi:hypothetical protein
MRKAPTSILTLALVATALAAAPARDADVRHFALAKSEPAKDAAVPSPSEIRLWFSQVPQGNSVSVRLVDAGGAALETGDLASDADDAKIVYLPLHHPLTAGRYTVAWRGIGDDGHVVRGEFGFSVTAEAP